MFYAPKLYHTKFALTEENKVYKVLNLISLLLLCSKLSIPYLREKEMCAAPNFRSKYTTPLKKYRKVFLTEKKIIFTQPIISELGKYIYV